MDEGGVVDGRGVLEKCAVDGAAWRPDAFRNASNDPMHLGSVASHLASKRWDVAFILRYCTWVFAVFAVSLRVLQL